MNDIYYKKNHLNLKDEDINYEYLLMTQKLYNELMKDMEIIKEVEKINDNDINKNLMNDVLNYVNNGVKIRDCE